MAAMPVGAGPLGAWLEPFAAALGAATWRRALVLVPGALLARALREGERAALALAHAGRADPMGAAALGTALPDRAGALGAVRARAREPAQAADGLGQTGPAAGRPPAGCRGAGWSWWPTAGGFAALEP